VVCIVAALGAVTMLSCTQDLHEDQMESKEIAGGMVEIRTALDGYKVATRVDMSSLDQTIEDISEAEDSCFNIQYAKEYLLGLLSTVADMLEGEHNYSFSLADTDSLLNVTGDLWSLISTDAGILSLLQNNSYTATINAGVDTLYTVDMTSKVCNEFESGSLEAGLQREIVVKMNGFQIIRIALLNSLDVKYSLQQLSLTPSSVKGIIVEYGGLLIDTSLSLVSTQSGNLVSSVSRDGQDLLNVACNSSRNGSVVSIDAAIDLMKEADITVHVNDLLQLLYDYSINTEYLQSQGVSFAQCSELASGWNSNVTIAVAMSESPFLDMHMGCLPIEGTEDLYVPAMLFTLAEYPDQELTYDELTASLGTDLIQLIMDLFTGGGGSGEDIPEIIL